MRQKSLRPPQIHNDITAFESADRAADDIPDSIFIFLVNLVLFSLADFLQHCLFGSLCGNPPEIFGGDLDLDHLFELSVRLDLTCLVKADFVVGSPHTFDHRYLREGFDVTRFTFNSDPYIPGWPDAFFGSR